MRSVCISLPIIFSAPRRLFLQDKIVANAIWRFLELRGFLLNTYRHSPLARAMYAAVKHAKVRFSCRSLPPSSLSRPASCSPPPPLPPPPLLVRSSPFHPLPALPLSPPSLPTQVPLTYTPAQVNDKLQDQCLELPLGIFEGDFDALLPASPLSLSSFALGLDGPYIGVAASKRVLQVLYIRMTHPVPVTLRAQGCSWFLRRAIVVPRSSTLRTASVPSLLVPHLQGLACSEQHSLRATRQPLSPHISDSRARVGLGFMDALKMMEIGV
ncbi:hypothetical protein C8J57DRAFT_1673847 [Mycena rebaudengoi]|nr:hypothetical protein C8J57DRAFT_1673847 [Mycena rebaudengoi]